MTAQLTPWRWQLKDNMMNGSIQRSRLLYAHSHYMVSQNRHANIAAQFKLFSTIKYSSTQFTCLIVYWDIIYLFTIFISVAKGVPISVFTFLGF